MEDPDLANWREIDQQGREPTWADFVGSAAGAVYLSPEGQAVRARLIEDFRSIFGARWLHRAMPGPGGGQIPWIGRFSPTLSLQGASGAAASFIELVRWWAAFKTQATQPGFGQVRKDLRSNITPSRLHHTLSQMRIGAIASTVGFDVAYELTSGGDIEISGRKGSVTVEVFAMGVGDDLGDKQRLSDHMFGFLDMVSRAYNVFFDGDLPPIDTDLEEWEERVEGMASTASRMGIAVTIESGGALLTVAPGSPSERTRLNGPPLEGEVGSRLARRASIKARQVKDAESGWLWIENQGAIDALVPVQRLDLALQLEAYSTLFDGALAGVESVHGLTFSTAGGTRSGVAPQLVAKDLATAVVTPLEFGRQRTSFHLPTSDSPAASIMMSILEGEATWLDVALGKLGVLSASDLVRPDIAC